MTSIVSFLYICAFYVVYNKHVTLLKKDTMKECLLMCILVNSEVTLVEIYPDNHTFMYRFIYENIHYYNQKRKGGQLNI